VVGLGGASQLSHESAEGFATGFVVAELVETGAGGRKQDDVARPRRCHRAGYRLGQHLALLDVHRRLENFGKARAGLTNGSFYGLKVSVADQPVAEESNEFGLGTATSGFVGSGRFSLHNFGDVSSMDALAIETASIAAGVTRFQRPEDGAWDPRNRNRDDFYFVTTASLTLNCRLWRLRFDDIEDPERGGTIEILLRGDEGHKMLDNVTIDRLGRILMDEDPGNSARISKVWLYAIETREFISRDGEREARVLAM